MWNGAKTLQKPKKNLQTRSFSALRFWWFLLFFAIFGAKNGDFQNLLKDSKTRANLLFDSGIICGMEPKPCKCQTKNLKTRSFSALWICLGICLGIPFRIHFLGGLKHSILTFVPNPFSGMHPNDVRTYAESFRAKLENFCKCQTKNLKNSDTSDTSDTSIFAIFGVKNDVFGVPGPILGSGGQKWPF